MPNYYCKSCNFISNLKGDYNRHLNTNKHKRNEKEYDAKCKKNMKMNHFESSENHFESFLDQKMNHFESKMNHFESLKHESKKMENSNFPKKNSKKIYECEFCSKEYSSSSNLRRHQKVCKMKKEDDNIIEMIQNLEKMHLQQLEIQKKQIDKIEHEKEGLRKQIETLIHKVGNTTNNTNITQNNNIILNCYGNEDLSHITDMFKTCLLKIPYSMIPKLIEEVHFNNKYPENQNIILPNKKEPYVKIYSDQKWIYKDRKETVKDS